MAHTVTAAALSAAAAINPTPNSEDRSWQSAIQDINGMISILTLLPILTGKRQNIKLVASRILPASFVLAGMGAGRVLGKLQLGILLSNFDLYRNTVGELTYAHDEYVNTNCPALIHIPTNTPERHATGAYINHNASEAFMVEAWFRTQGRPAVVELKQSNTRRMLCSYIIYIMLYVGESYIALRNAAVGCEHIFAGLQACSVIIWLGCITTVQIRRGQGRDEFRVNRIGSEEYRCFQIPTSGENVSSVRVSFHLDNLSKYRLFVPDYEQPILAIAGMLILLSATLDIFSTVLIVGKTQWAYPWIGIELLLIFTKVIFCMEPLRQMEIRGLRYQDDNTAVSDRGLETNVAQLIPLHIPTDPAWRCLGVWTTHISLQDVETGVEWRSTTAGVSIGQDYVSIDNDTKAVKHLAFSATSKSLCLVDEQPALQTNQALQREFLAALCSITKANCVPSKAFLDAVEKTSRNIAVEMNEMWYDFGSKELTKELEKQRWYTWWRRFM